MNRNILTLTIKKRLNNKDIEALTEEARRLKEGQNKIVSLQDKREYDWIMKCLAQDHSKKLRAAINTITDIYRQDVKAQKIPQGTTKPPKFAELLKYYKTSDLEEIRRHVKEIDHVLYTTMQEYYTRQDTEHSNILP